MSSWLSLRSVRYASGCGGPGRGKIARSLPEVPWSRPPLQAEVITSKTAYHEQNVRISEDNRARFPMTNPAKIPQLAIGRSAIGAATLGALALGALAIGAFAIGRLNHGSPHAGNARVKSVSIEDLHVHRLVVINSPI
jgi:hypothetical protein